MRKLELTVFLCTGKDCSKVWHHVCHGSPSKWLRKQVKDAELPCKLNVVKTACMDHCDQAACLCCVQGGHSEFATVRSPHDADELLKALAATTEPAMIQ